MGQSFLSSCIKNINPIINSPIFSANMNSVQGHLGESKVQFNVFQRTFNSGDEVIFSINLDVFKSLLGFRLNRPNHLDTSFSGSIDFGIRIKTYFTKLDTLQFSVLSNTYLSTLIGTKISSFELCRMDTYLYNFLYSEY